VTATSCFKISIFYFKFSNSNGGFYRFLQYFALFFLFVKILPLYILKK